ncbi:hypothetical protein Hanom_Chr15g01371891 [Helianthus anomalus]
MIGSSLELPSSRLYGPFLHQMLYRLLRMLYISHIDNISPNASCDLKVYKKRGGNRTRVFNPNQTRFWNPLWLNTVGLEPIRKLKTGL